MVNRKRELGIVGDESRQKKQRRVSEDEDDLTADSDRSRSSAAFHRKLPQTPSVANRPVRRAKRNERMYSINGSPLRAEDEEAEPRSKRSSMRLAAMEDEQDETDPLVNDRPPKQSFVPPGGPEYSFDPTKILSAAMTGSFAVPKDPAQKRELEKHMKKMQEEFEKIQKMMAGGVKSGAAAKKGPVQLKAAKAKAGR